YYLPESVDAVGSFLRDRFGGPVAGSSAGLCGVFAAFCLMNAGMSIRLFYLVPIKAGALLAAGFGLAGLLVIIPSDPSVAHLAHLGGLLAGMVMVKAGMGRGQ
ncbi:MAG: rhomboid family intramembrane serine protease, partial [Verrucomicrobia bacterium]|nr:rhomboid family intramembrane serine protease [Verrucomicrobiota bacterium]